MDYEKTIISWLETETGETGLSLEMPKDTAHGDYAFPCFILAKKLQKAPQIIASELSDRFSLEQVQVAAIGPYLNFTILDNSKQIETLKHILSGNIIQKTAEPKVVLIESPGPNTNKPLHLGHLRNMLLGISLTHALRAIGKTVHTVNVNNDRGIHICKSMLAYQLFGDGKTPQSEGRKSDHFVGDYYVKFAQACAESEERKTELENQAQEMLTKWEAGDQEVLALWKKMNDWCLAGFQETYKRMGLTIEKEYFESETYQGGKDIILKGAEDGLFYKNEKGAIEADLEDKGLGKKVLLRSDGTSVYITQDINMAHLRYQDFSFDEMIYIVGNEQEYHFKVLFELFRMLGWSFGESCRHFSYGMIELPEGKMKSREGNVIDTDDLIKTVDGLAYEAVKERYEDLDEAEMNERARAISTGAIRFFFLKFDPLKNFVFNPKESLSFEGETGPYVQYTHARISSILRKSDAGNPTFTHLNADEDKQLLKQLGEFQSVVERMAEELRPSALCQYLIKVCQQFNSYYSKHQVIQEDKDVEADRVALLSAVQKVLKAGLEILGITALERM
ncbi:MAG: arginine--tRNA ligase [Nanoarchaeota archaeon]|nr:arginine--tRNA ligase [Nanoarchaeota archaeon]